MAAFRLIAFFAMLTLVVLPVVSDAAEVKKSAPPSLRELLKNQRSFDEESPMSPELEAKADADDAFSSRVDAPDLILELTGTAAHGVRERIRQRGVFANPECVRQKKDDPSCYCAAYITIPVFSKRIYPLAARPLNYNIWEAMDDVVDTPQCPLGHTQTIADGDPSTLR